MSESKGVGARYKVEYKPWWFGGSYVDYWRGEATLYRRSSADADWEEFDSILLKDEWLWWTRLGLWVEVRRSLRAQRKADRGRIPRKDRTHVKYYG